MNLFEGRLVKKEEDHRPGTVRWTDEAGKVQVCEPHAYFYSTALFLAKEVWSEGAWKPIFSELDDDASMPENAAP